MDCDKVQVELEKHKMDIIVGLTNLKRAELTSCEYVLNSLYDIFSNKMQIS